MGGMARKSPFTFWTFLIGAFALAAIPPTTAGLSSKDLILSQAWQSGGAGRVFWALGIAGAFVTSIYIFRLVFIVFGGTPRAAAPAAGHGHGASAAGGHAAPGHAAGRNGMQAGPVMGIPLLLLALLCLGGGLLSFPQFLGGKPILVDFLQTSLPQGAGAVETSVRTEWVLSIIAEAASLLGIPVAWIIVRLRLRAGAADMAGAAAGAASSAAPVREAAHVRFLQNGWGFDWIYEQVFVKPFMLLARVNARDVVDRLFDGVGGLNMLLSKGLRWTQNGRVRWYAAGARCRCRAHCRRGGAAMILALLVAVPLVFGIAGWALGRRNTDWSRWLTLAANAINLVIVALLWAGAAGALNIGVPALPSTPWLAQVRWPWIPGLGISFSLEPGWAQPRPPRAHRVPRHHVRPGILEGHQGQGRVLSLQSFPGTGGRERRIPCHRPLPLRLLLGAHADPDVFPHRPVGPREPPQGRGEVLPLHPGRRPAHAGVHHRPGRGAQHGFRIADIRIQ